MLPAGSQWKWKEIKFEGYETKAPLVVYYRDGLECIESLFADPRFVNHLDLIPRREYLDEDCTIRTYNEMMTGQIPWEVQVRRWRLDFHFEVTIAHDDHLGLLA